MANLQTVRLKPNPSGKDRTRRGGATATQLGSEWADIKNVCVQAVKLDGVGLYHIAYSADGRTSRWEKIMGFKGILQPSAAATQKGGVGGSRDFRKTSGHKEVSHAQEISRPVVG